MKCPECGRNWKRSGGMRCQCRYPFAFDPKTTGLTDGRFMAATAAASGQGSRWFTPNQLYAALWLRRAARLRWKLMVVGAVAGLVGGWLLGGVWWLLAIPAAAAGYALGQSRPAGPSMAEFHGQLARWQQHRRDPNLKRLIEAPNLHEPPPDWSEPDIYDYGVERILIVQHDLLVDWFVRNGLHADQRALVISESGYPGYLRPQVQRQLEERPDTPVFLLHDPGHSATAMQTALRSNGDLSLPDVEWIDLGLSPSDVGRFPTLRHARSPTVDMIPWTLLVGALGASLMARTALAQAATSGAGWDSDFG